MLLKTIPGVGDLLGLTFASEIGDVARFATPRKLIGYAGLAPRVTPVRRPVPHRRALEGGLAHAALGRCRSRPRRLAADQPLARALRRLAQRAGKNPAKSAVARKILIACWHILNRHQPFKPARSQSSGTDVSASSRCFLAA